MPVAKPPADFINAIGKEKLLIDSRSEGEFMQGSIPGAVNVPLLNNEHRHLVGLTYKQQGQKKAIEKGFELVGPLFYNIVQQINKLTSSPDILLYCWRGGLRSNIMAWVLETCGFKVTLLKGGYKHFRRWTLTQFEINRSLLILGGRTGSGKTELLAAIKESGEQAICLETLASHRGSAFGALGLGAQPTQENFENCLAYELAKTDPTKILWLENESRNIGMNKIPDSLFMQMRQAHVMEIEVDRSDRLKRILNEYGKFPISELKEKTLKLSKRMGGQNVKQAVQFLEEENMEAWAGLLLDYYDKTYAYSNEQRDNKNSHRIPIGWRNPVEELRAVIEQASVVNQ